MGRIGPCLCGDTACPSCGPLLGGDEPFEKVVDSVMRLLPPGDPVDAEEVAIVMRALGQFPRIADLIYVMADIVFVGPPVVDIPLGTRDINYINAELEKVRPCKKHDLWPDPEAGCPACYHEALDEEAALAEEYWRDMAREEGLPRKE